ncbi:transposase [archaeon]|nr:MAG: transposase [archaeon]
MIFAYKIRHHTDFSEYLQKAKRIAQFTVNQRNRDITYDNVKHIGLNAVLAQQLIKVYKRNKTLKRVKKVNLVVPGRAVLLNRARKEICIPSLGFSFYYSFPNTFEKVSLVEINNKYAYVSVTLPEDERDVRSWIGIDLNTTGHVAVAASPETGKVAKFGKEIPHRYKKYENIKAHMRARRDREGSMALERKKRRALLNLTNDVANKIVDIASETNNGICLERVGGRSKHRTCVSDASGQDSLNSWIFYQLATTIELKAKLRGVPVAFIDPYNTSKLCSVCGHAGKRYQKKFECPVCGHVEHADVNAAFNIGLRYPGNAQSHADRGVCEGSDGAPEELLITALSASERALA